MTMKNYKTQTVKLDRTSNTAPRMHFFTYTLPAASVVSLYLPSITAGVNLFGEGITITCRYGKL